MTLQSLQEEMSALNNLWKHTDNMQNQAMQLDKWCSEYKKTIQERIDEVESLLDNADLPR